MLKIMPERENSEHLSQSTASNMMELAISYMFKRSSNYKQIEISRKNVYKRK